MDQGSVTYRHFGWTVALVVLIGLNLRPSMAAIGPLADSLRETLGVSYANIAVLTTLPVLAMGIGCFIGPLASRRLGSGRLIGIALAAIAASDALHWLGLGYAGLCIAAAGAGLGIAFVQATLPTFIKAAYPSRTALLMGFYIATVMGGAAVASTLSPIISAWLEGWETGLAIWSLLALAALVAWSLRGPVLPKPLQSSDSRQPTGSPFRSARFWSLAVFFGLGTAGYTCILAWIPPNFTGLGWSRSSAGIVLGYITAVEIAAGLIFPAVAQRYTDRRPVLCITLSLAMAGFLLLGWRPLSMVWVAATLLGLGIGGLFPLSLIMTLDHAEDAALAGRVTAWVQGVGYLIAALSPLAAGIAKDLLGSFSSAWVALALLFAGLLGLCGRFSPTSAMHHFDRRAIPPTRTGLKQPI